MAIQPKLTTIAACQVAGIDRDRFNEHVASGAFPCAPQTVPGRARLFDADDMIALRLFRELLDDGVNAKRAGEIACAVARSAKLHPDAPAIAYVEYYIGSGEAYPSHVLPAAVDWDHDTVDETTTPRRDIRKATTFRVSKVRALVAHYIEEQRSIIGPLDE